MKICKKIFFLFLSFLFITIIFSCTHKRNTISIDNWQILHSETSNFYEAKNNNNWQLIKNIKNFHYKGKRKEQYHYIWLKGSFKVEKKKSKKYGLALGRVYHLEKVYLNNTFIGETLPGDIHTIHSPRSYSFNSSFLSLGSNSIFLRIGIYGYNNGGLPEDIKIVSYSTLKKIDYISNILFFQLPMGIFFLMLGFFILTFIMYCFNREDKMILYSGLSLMVFIIHLLLVYSPISIVGFPLFHWASSTMTPLVAILNILLFQSIYGKYLSQYNKIVMPIFIVAFIYNIASIESQMYSIAVAIRYLVGILTLLISIPSYFIYIVKLNSYRNDRFRLSISLVYSIVYISALFYEIYSIYFGGKFTYLIFTILSPFFILLFVLIYAKVSLERKREMDQLYSSLRCKNQIKKTSLSYTSEEKINSIIEFINENHTSYLSREELASSIDMSPNYMSNLFKQITGIKINDYINEMRIKSAMTLLKEKDDTIISIAFSCGFDSLATFNRIFKKVQGTTPSSFRISN